MSSKGKLQIFLLPSDSFFGFLFLYLVFSRFAIFNVSLPVATFPTKSIPLPRFPSYVIETVFLVQAI